MINTLFLTLWLLNLLWSLSFSIRKHTSKASPAILSNFFEEQRTQNHPQYLSGLSRALFPTTFLQIAAYLRCWCCCEIQFLNKNLQTMNSNVFFCGIYINGVADFLRWRNKTHLSLAGEGTNARLAKSKLKRGPSEVCLSLLINKTLV